MALSGGMKQRVGLARAFSIEPKVLLLDEPFAQIDALTRGVIQEELIQMWNTSRNTVFMVTHDVDEAILAVRSDPAHDERTGCADRRDGACVDSAAAITGNDHRAPALLQDQKPYHPLPGSPCQTWDRSEVPIRARRRMTRR